MKQEEEVKFHHGYDGAAGLLYTCLFGQCLGGEGSCPRAEAR